MAYKVLIVEDQEMPRQLFEIFIKSSDAFQHAGSIANASLALSVCRRTPIDLILMDVMTELGHDGLEAAAEIKKAFPKIKVIIVTSMPEYSWLERARKAGVDSFWYKDGNKQDILQVMERTMAGERIYPDETPLVHIGNSNNHEFTDRELDILRELITGDSNKEIGENLNISANTVKYHVQNLLDKTGFRTRTELAAEARSLGIVVQKRNEFQ
ncbi:MAG: response regulator transcription factor [Eubacteriales bacterium]|nr:response regulator transcription factor [Eubacteriales bacterium]